MTIMTDDDDDDQILNIIFLLKGMEEMEEKG